MKDIHDAYAYIAKFLEHIYIRKLVSALGYLTPAGIEV